MTFAIEHTNLIVENGDVIVAEIRGDINACGNLAYAERIVKAVNAHSEALDLLSAVTQSDGRVSDVLWNQIVAFLRKVES